MSKVKNYIRNNKLNVATYIISLIGIVIYIIGVATLKNTGTTLKEILSMSANYVAILSCIIVLVQLVAFFSDSRHKESRCKKESALKLAEDYATNILINITFIENVASVYYDSDASLLRRELINMEIDKFTLKDMQKQKELSKYYEIFENGKYPIPNNIILDTSLSYDLTYPIFEASEADDSEAEDRKNKSVNIKFKHIINHTLNKLECFSMAVNHNVAESEMLFPSLHQTYLMFVRFMYPYICMNNKDEEEFYTNVIELYRTWENVKNTIEECREEGRKHAEKMIRDKKRKFRKPL